MEYLKIFLEDYMKKEVKKSVTPIIPSKMIMEIFIVVFGISFLFYLLCLTAYFLEMANFLPHYILELIF